MRKITIFFLLTMLVYLYTNYSVYASEESDYDSQIMNEYYAKRYGISRYFYEETVYYRPVYILRARRFPNLYKKVLLYQHQSSSGVPTIAEWQSVQISPWVNFVPRAEISASAGTSFTYTTTWSVTGGIEVTFFKDILNASPSATYQKSDSDSFHQESEIVANYNFAVNVLFFNKQRGRGAIC